MNESLRRNVCGAHDRDQAVIGHVQEGQAERRCIEMHSVKPRRRCPRRRLRCCC
ncbi:hypothetical protein OAO87_00495 [bacterium]|nr:hypothetical protein [bacterium]